MDSLDGLGLSIFTNIYIVICSTPTTTIFSVYFLMQPSGGGKQNEEGVLWFHLWTMQARIKKEEEYNPSSQPGMCLCSSS